MHQFTNGSANDGRCTIWFTAWTLTLHAVCWTT